MIYKNIPHNIYNDKTLDLDFCYQVNGYIIGYIIHFNCRVNDYPGFRGHSLLNSLKRVCQLFSSSSVLSELDSSGSILDAVSQVAASSLSSLVFHSGSDLHLTPQSIKLHNLVPIPNLSAVVPSSTLLRKEQSSTFLSSESVSYWSSGTQLRRGMSLGIHAVFGYYRARHTTGGHFLGNLSAWSRNLTKELRDGAGSRGMQRTAWSSV